MILIACVLRFSPMPDFKASFVSSDGENPPPPLFCLKSGFYPRHVNFCKSVENVKVTGVERANMLEDAQSQVEHLCELKNILGDEFQKSDLGGKTC